MRPWCSQTAAVKSRGSLRWESEGEDEEHSEEDKDVESLGLLLLGDTLDLNEENCAGNEHGWSKEQEVEGIHGDERHLAVLGLQ